MTRKAKVNYHNPPCAVAWGGQSVDKGRNRGDFLKDR